MKICRCSRSRIAERRRGSAVVELAIVAPLLVMIFMGMVEVSRGIMVQQILTNAAREGARESIMEGASTSDVQTTVTQYLADTAIPGATVSVTPDPTAAAPRQQITVMVSVPYANVKWLVTPVFFGSGAELSATCSMRCEAG